MKILLLATEDFLGAGKAVHRMYSALSNAGIPACLLVKHKVNGSDPNIIAYNELFPQKRGLLDRLWNRISNKWKKPIQTDPEYYFFQLNDQQIRFDIKAVLPRLPFVPTVIVATWISRFVNEKILRDLQQGTGAKLVIFPMDMSMITGGCHYAWDCKGYQYECNDCPAILSPSKKHVAHDILLSKKLHFKGSAAKLVGVSSQIINEARSSALFREQLDLPKVYLPIDRTIFRKANKANAKESMGLPLNSKVIFFGTAITTEKRKGIDHYIAALHLVHNKLKDKGSETSNILVMIAGMKPEGFEQLYPIPFNSMFIGYIKEDVKLAMAYQASEVFVSASLQDTGPMMINESVCCGTPVVAFKLGVAQDLVIDGVSGFTANCFDVESMAASIAGILSMSETEYKVLQETTAKTGEALMGYDIFVQQFRQVIQQFN